VAGDDPCDDHTDHRRLTPETTMTDTDPIPDDAPIMHRSGAIQAHIDGQLVTFPTPKIGQLRRLRDLHHEANDKVNAITTEYNAKQASIGEQLEALQQEMTTAATDDDAMAAVKDARVKLSTLRAEIDALVRDGQRAAIDAQTDLAAEWFTAAAKELVGIDLPPLDDLPVWMGRLGSVRSFVEHWMTHPSPRGV
jgi:phage host-nuclease inhibitor protein Gam